jgi:hypothetical protein
VAAGIGFWREPIETPAIRSLGPKTAVTSSGTTTCFCGRRVNQAGLILERISPKGSSTGVLSCAVSAAKAPDGEPLRNSPKETRTPPVGSCATAALRESAKEPPRGAPTNGFKLAGRRATIGPSGK